MKKPYASPMLSVYGSVAQLTAALGGSAQQDQSDYPEQFPPDGGSFDVCNNNDPNTTC